MLSRSRSEERSHRRKKRRSGKEEALSVKRPRRTSPLAARKSPLSPILQATVSESSTGSTSEHTMVLRPREYPALTGPGDILILSAEKAKGKAAARNYYNQTTFMQLFGLVDDCHQTESCSEIWRCPISDMQAELLATAGSHIYMAGAHVEQKTDGYVHVNKVSVASVAVSKPGVYMCDCKAHGFIANADADQTCVENLKKLIRAPLELDLVTGNDFATGFLMILFHFMRMPQFKVSSTGRIEEVSYTLIKNGQKYPFRGIPDYLVHKDLAGADRVIVATGEVQSTNQADVQNSIYGIGKLLETCCTGRPIICITLFKNKWACLSVARWCKRAPEPTPNFVHGTVTLKYLQSPNPINLTSPEGVKTFSARLYHMLNNDDV